MRTTLPIYPLQHEAALMLAHERGGIAWWKPGEGKTSVALAAFLYYLPEGDVTSQLQVFCRTEAFYDWVQEARRIGMPPERLILTSGGILSTKSRDAVVRDICRNPRIAMVCFDELYLYKNYQALRTIAAQQIGRFKPVVGLSGSIMTAKKLEDVFGQTFAVNKYKRVSNSMTAFREEFMMGINEHGFTRYSPKRGAYASLMGRCAEFCHVHMPTKGARKIIESNVTVDVTSQQEAIFDELRDTMQVLDLDICLDNALALMVKLQQVSNGWIKGPDGTIHTVASNKATRCISLIEELRAAGRRVVVWCAFRHDLEVLRLASIGKFNSLPMMGGEEFDIERWNDPQSRTDVVFATEASGSSVNHFSQVEYAIYYSMSQRWLDFQQSRARTDRSNSLHGECFYYFMHTASSIDESILRRVRQAGSAEGAMLRIAADLKKWLLKEEVGDKSELVTSH